MSASDETPPHTAQRLHDLPHERGLPTRRKQQRLTALVDLSMLQEEISGKDGAEWPRNSSREFLHRFKRSAESDRLHDLCV
jgi:hypothetical protein